ncbi:MAG: hypothetical protein COV45_08745 [Deltaproteobacteria bacterium CG11_big_fil_rev_8_21_14_0_20_47_16]|nr:MAG: hypothetical protein COV45_08745 [Deltaproteobacteria bacterium CG11_big_fil_rev_8_21_14_0_20_47_16]
MKKLALTILTLTLASAATPALAENFSVTAGGMGNIYVVDARPELDPGVGGYFAFDYRWAPELSTTFSVVVTTQNGTGISAGNNNILVFGIPTVDFKYYPIPEATYFDPFLLGGVGFYLVSDGSGGNGTQAAGMGAQAGVGCDFYFTQKLSFQFMGIFRSIALIDGISGTNNGTAIFPFSLQGGLSYHF